MRKAVTMSVIPETLLGQIEFCEQHISAWGAAPTSIGLTAADVTALDLLTTQARSMYNDALAARLASKTATAKYHDSTGTMREKAAAMVRTIKAYAEATNNPNVYTTAQIPPPAAPTPPPPPGQPENISIGLNPDGSLILRWKATNASASSGAYFAVSRRIGLVGGFTTVGGVAGGSTGGRFEYVDASLPLGTQQCTYIIQGRRGTQTGEPSDAIVVQFGVGGGTMTVTGGTLALAA